MSIVFSASHQGRTYHCRRNCLRIFLNKKDFTIHFLHFWSYENEFSILLFLTNTEAKIQKIQKCYKK